MSIGLSLMRRSLAVTQSTSFRVKEEPGDPAHAQEIVIKEEEEEAIDKKSSSSVTILPLSCFLCSLNFLQRDAKFIYRHYCYHFRNKLLGKLFSTVEKANFDLGGLISTR
jgi:hypothetical protein